MSWTRRSKPPAGLSQQVLGTRDVSSKGQAADPLNTHMQIQEVITAQKSRTPQQQRVSALKTQLAQARVAAQRQRLAARQARLNQQRAALNTAPPQ